MRRDIWAQNVLESMSFGDRFGVKKDLPKHRHRQCQRQLDQTAPLPGAFQQRSDGGRAALGFERTHTVEAEL